MVVQTTATSAASITLISILPTSEATTIDKDIEATTSMNDMTTARTTTHDMTTDQETTHRITNAPDSKLISAGDI